MGRLFLCCLASSFLLTFAFFAPLLGETPEPKPKSPARLSDDVEVPGRIPTNTGSELQITVKVYNSSNVLARDLTNAEAQAETIFQKAGIKVIWVAGLMVSDVNDGSAGNQWNPAHIHVRLWTRSTARPKVVASDTLGFCLSMEKSQAVVLSDAVQNLAARRFTNPANLLGLAMAHEIGHLLLRSATHSAAGIMQARWSSEDFRAAEEGLLVFTREQGRSMRNEVRRRAEMR